jgi:HAD superfamily phosphoserine phosphatase-like hydrolase
MDASWADILALVNSMELDDFFIDFVNLCKNRNYPIYILSDGYTELIKLILNRYDLDWIPVYANRLQYNNGLFNIQCLGLNDNCAKCGACKTNLLQQLRGNNQAVYVGDGHSDMCVCHHAQVVFAKDALWNYCLKNNVDAIYYESFKDIIDWLEK